MKFCIVAGAIATLAWLPLTSGFVVRGARTGAATRWTKSRPLSSEPAEDDSDGAIKDASAAEAAPTPKAAIPQEVPHWMKYYDRSEKGGGGASLDREPNIWPADSPTNKMLDRGRTLPRFVEMEVWQDFCIDNEVIDMLVSFGKACSDVSTLVRRAQTDGIAGVANTGLNVQGEVQKRLDVLANTIVSDGLCFAGNIESIASEEEESSVLCKKVCNDAACSGAYVAAFDPLDGSANIEAGLPCGTILGISKRSAEDSGDAAIMKPGTRLVASGYCLYGASTVMVLTLGRGTHEFVLDDKRHQFILSKRNIKIPQSGRVYSFNEANAPYWHQNIRKYVDKLKNGKGWAGEKYESRYVGALIADVHRVLHEGGIFGYPADSKSPNGKLRLLYESSPIAMIMEQAGGAAVDGRGQRMLEVRPCSLHHRTAAFFGSTEEIQELKGYLIKP